MLIIFFFLMHLQDTECQGKEVMLERRAIVRKTEKSKNKKRKKEKNRRTS